MLPILVLAAGRSSRMGGLDKLSETIQGVPLLRRSLEVALGCKCPVFVALPPRPHPRYALLANLPATVLEVPNAALGMAESLKSGLTSLPAQAQGVLVHLADMPDLTTDDLMAVRDTWLSNPDAQVVRGTAEDGRPGHPVLFARQLFDLLSRLNGDEGARSVLRHVQDRTVSVRLPAENALTDLDTPEAWAAWRALNGDEP